ncbi:hypothetical protein DL95DRAFT_405680 [Leptodontidium sp. 2 PMI_412]|nr:hypothetical protein DL95DRAFT_405680 [Leptodontidium sp. 2 PMI_412]
MSAQEAADGKVNRNRSKRLRCWLKLRKKRKRDSRRDVSCSRGKEDSSGEKGVGTCIPRDISWESPFSKSIFPALIEDNWYEIFNGAISNSLATCGYEKCFWWFNLWSKQVKVPRSSSPPTHPQRYVQKLKLLLNIGWIIGVKSLLLAFKALFKKTASAARAG